jgi:hypothetical protein
LRRHDSLLTVSRQRAKSTLRRAVDRNEKAAAEPRALLTLKTVFI